MEKSSCPRWYRATADIQTVSRKLRFNGQRGLQKEITSSSSHSLLQGRIRHFALLALYCYTRSWRSSINLKPVIDVSMIETRNSSWLGLWLVLRVTLCLLLHLIQRCYGCRSCAYWLSSSYLLSTYCIDLVIEGSCVRLWNWWRCRAFYRG
jgi:hypothetical protein